MTIIDKTDIENIKFIKRELKLKNILTVKIKKGDYEIKISSQTKEDNQKINQVISQKES